MRPRLIRAGMPPPDNIGRRFEFSNPPILHRGLVHCFRLWGGNQDYFSAKGVYKLLTGLGLEDKILAIVMIKYKGRNG